MRQKSDDAGKSDEVWQYLDFVLGVSPGVHEMETICVYGGRLFLLAYTFGKSGATWVNRA